MKRIVLISAIILGSISAQAAQVSRDLKHDNIERVAKSEKGIKFFEGTWEEALKKAKTEKKLIFLDAYASWCGPCKMMTAYTFTEESVGTFFNENFINVKMDMEKNAEGPRLSTKYNLTAYPTLYFVNSTEDVVHKSLGYLKAKQLISQGKLALEK